MSKNTSTTKQDKPVAGKTFEAPASKDVASVPIIRDMNFNKAYATRVLVSRTDYDFRSIIVNEKINDGKGHECFIGESMIIFTPIAAKEFHQQIGKLIAEWEKEKGVIAPRPPTSRFTVQGMD